MDKQTNLELQKIACHVRMGVIEVYSMQNPVIQVARYPPLICTHTFILKR